MTNQTIDNSADEQFGNVILWQYDKAYNLVALVNEIKTFFNSTTKNIWDTYALELNINTSTEYGLSILGTLLGIQRPQFTTTAQGENESDEDYAERIAQFNADCNELYANILRAKFRLMMSNRTVADINQYLYTIFGGAVYVKDNGALLSTATDYAPMTIWWMLDGDTPVKLPNTSAVNGSSLLSAIQKQLLNNYPDLVFDYPAAVRDGSVLEHIIFGFDGQQPDESTDPEIGGLDDSNFTADTLNEAQFIPENERITP